MANVFARKSADIGVVVVVVLSDELVKTAVTIGSEGVADATAVTLHPNTSNVDVKSCAIRPSSRITRKWWGLGWKEFRMGIRGKEQYLGRNSIDWH